MNCCASWSVATYVESWSRRIPAIGSSAGMAATPSDVLRHHPHAQHLVHETRDDGCSVRGERGCPRGGGCVALLPELAARAVEQFHPAVELHPAQPPLG